MSPRILVVEDEPDIAAIVVDYLRHAGYTVEHQAEGRAALASLITTPPDLTLLDIMLPGMDGLDILRQARRHTQHPIIMLTARVEEVDRLIGLELGADDYICKPFSPREVVARVKAVLRRAAPGAPPLVGVATALVLDEALWQATLHGTPLHLTRREFKLLQVLARQRGRIFSRAQLLDQAYDDTLDVNERAIDSHIKNLRKKLKAASGDDTDWIRSVYGVGFALDPAASN
ncbi:DNA-binding response regulator [Acidovorax sp. GW101-3H11]|uniref:response regulator n=1 Tax=Acidovorax sp. GW101-3H11 TaxID=1813946 RepID=UPI0007B504AB|nr:response regulator [Acidovorax sp. GW101-3H11]KZT14615.1 DNA-binding response regulator [Acidovorax sp. GW101-3H11]